MNKNTLNVMFSQKNDIWSTPKEIYNYYMNLDYFDPCPINPQWNGLEISWKEKNFVNPPYSDITTWVDKIINEVIINDAVVILLIPSRTDTKYFHKLINNESLEIQINFFKGRLKFGNSKNSAPFPSMLLMITKGNYYNNGFNSVSIGEFTI